MASTDRAAVEPVWSQSYPAFLARLSSDPEGAFEEFAEHAWRYLDVRCRAILRGLDADERTSVMTDVILYFGKDDHRALRDYRDRGIPFFPGYFRKKVKWAADEARRRRRPPHVEITPDTPDPRQQLDEALADQEACRILCEFMEEIGEECKVLLLGRYRDGRSHLDLAPLIGWPRNKNKQVAAKVDRCRSRLLEKLRTAGILRELAM